MLVGRLSGSSAQHTSRLHRDGHGMVYRQYPTYVCSRGRVMYRCAARQGSSDREQAPPSNTPVSSSLMGALLRNPVAFFGGFFVGIMELDVTQDPLREWIQERVQESRN